MVISQIRFPKPIDSRLVVTDHIISARVAMKLLNN